MNETQRRLIADAIARVEALHPDLRTANLDGWLDRVVYLCRLSDETVGRKRNPSGRISPNVIGIAVDSPAGWGHFYGIDIARDGTGELRPEWIVYEPGPVSDEEHIGPDQAWIRQMYNYSDTAWGDIPKPKPLPTDDDNTVTIIQMLTKMATDVTALRTEVAHLSEQHENVLKEAKNLQDKLPSILQLLFK